MRGPQETRDADIMPIFPPDPPQAGGRQQGGPIAIFQHPNEDWPTQTLQTVIEQAQGCIDDGAAPGLLVPVVNRAREILEQRRKRGEHGDTDTPHQGLETGARAG